jgi:CheY-like chemotaxis protein
MTSVLVVDDDPNGNDILCRLLRVFGHRAVGAFTGEEGLGAIAECRPDVVVLDYMMPGLSGIETLCRIRANVATATLPVIMYTAVGDMDLRNRAMRAGANDFFAKGMMDFSSLCLMIAQYADCDRQPAAA